MERHPRIVLLGATLALLLGPRAVDARTWHIAPDGSGDAPTVQAGIDSATAGDEVLLAPGTYTWTSQGASGQSMIHMKSGLTLRGAAGAEGTVIDGESLGRVLRCVDASDVRIEGLTITRGLPMAGPPEQFPDYPPNGGGIYIAGASSNVVISHCVFRGNTTAFHGTWGGGIRCVNTTIMDCQFVENRTAYDGAGAGIYCDDSSILRCVFRDNAIGGDAGARGAAAFLNGNSSISDSWFEANLVIGGYAASGGAVYVRGQASIERCTFVDNIVRGQTENGGWGGAVYSLAPITISSCVFLHNQALGGWYFGPVGGAVYSYGPATITSCTLIGNVASGGTGAYGIGGLALEGGGSVANTIIAQSTGAPCWGNATYACCDLYANSSGDAICGADGGGNFVVAPQFCAEDPITTRNVTLQSDSPCAPGNHPNQAPCGLIGAAPVGCGSVSVEARTWSEVKSLYRR